MIRQNLMYCVQVKLIAPLFSISSDVGSEIRDLVFIETFVENVVQRKITLIMFLCSLKVNNENR